MDTRMWLKLSWLPQVLGFNRCGIDAPARRHAGIWRPSKPSGHASHSCIHVKLCDNTFYTAYRILLHRDKQPQETSPPAVAIVARSEARTPP